MSSKRTAPPEYRLPPIEIDGSVTVRHVGGATQTATLWYVDAEEVQLRFGIAGIRVASLRDVDPTRSRVGIRAGHFKDKKMRSWRIDSLDLERLRASAAEHRGLYERLKDERYGQDPSQIDPKKGYGQV
jgi:hypothetical protein